MIVIRPSRPEDAPGLFTIWLAAIRATHTFLAEEDVAYFSAQVRDVYLPTAPLWVAEYDGRVAAFMGLTGANVDSLFAHPSEHGKGIGRALIEHAQTLEGALTVDVNEQNPGACAFYERMGFSRVGRSERDDEGKPYPILHLAQDI